MIDLTVARPSPLPPGLVVKRTSKILSGPHSGQQVAVGCFAAEITSQTFGDVIDAAASFRHGKEIHERARGIGDGDLHRSAPQRFHPEQTFGENVLQDEDGALRGDAFPDGRGGL
jgi:hypothetical protein